MSLSIIKRNLCVNSTVRKLGDRNSKTGDTFVPREYYWNLIPLLEKSKDYQNVIPLLEKSRNPKIYVSVIADWKSLVPQVFIVCKLTFFQMNKIHDRATSTYFWSQLNQLVSNSSKKGEWIFSTNCQLGKKLTNLFECLFYISCQWDKLSVALTLVTVFINTCCKPGLLQNSPISPRRRCAECGQ